MNCVGIDGSKCKSMISVMRPLGEMVIAPLEVGHTDVELCELSRLLRERRHARGDGGNGKLPSVGGQFLSMSAYFGLESKFSVGSGLVFCTLFSSPRKFSIFSIWGLTTFGRFSRPNYSTETIDIPIIT